MKQLVGLYASGISPSLALTGANEMAEAFFIKRLASTMTAQVSVQHQFKPIHVMGNVKPGLYIGIVNVGDTIEVKVIPFNIGNQEELNKMLDQKMLADCTKALDIMFGITEDTAGEPTPAYVNQDPS